MSEENKVVSVMGVHASYSVSKKSRKSDYVLVKERHTYADGSCKVNLRGYIDFKRDFYVTRPKFRNHQSKKEWESIKRLERFKCTQAEMIPKIARVLNKREQPLRRLAQSPYLYGADVDSTTIILHKYIEAYGQGIELPTVAAMDYEWDIATKRPTIGSYCFGDDVYLTIRRDMIEACGYQSVDWFITNLKKRFYAEAQPIYDDYYTRMAEKKVKVVPRKFKLHVEVVDLDLDVVRKLFRQTHLDQPDYLAFWNGISDLEIILPLCERYSVDPSDFMNDPSVPEEYRYTKLDKGHTETIDANGNPKKLKNSEQWHILNNMASWQFIDMMCCYHTSRAHKNDLPSYAFQYVIPLELGLGKLRLVEELDHLEDVDPEAWHNQMSMKYFLEYAIYATGDVIAPVLLEDKNYEIRGQSYPNLTFNPLSHFKKNPRQLCNNMHFICLEHSCVVGTTSNQMREDMDDLIYPASNWIITLNSSYHDTLGGYALSDSYQPTLYIPSNNDGDLTSSYPSNQWALNMSRSTRVTEVISVRGVPIEKMKMVGMDLSTHGQNSIDFCTSVFNMPHMQEIVAAYEKSIGRQVI